MGEEGQISKKLNQSLIRKHVTSAHCKSLILKHRSDLDARQLTVLLIKKNRLLSEKNSKRSVNLFRALLHNKKRLMLELSSVNHRLVNLEEKIILLGCPGVTL